MGDGILRGKLVSGGSYLTGVKDFVHRTGLGEGFFLSLLCSGVQDGVRSTYIQDGGSQ